MEFKTTQQTLTEKRKDVSVQFQPSLLFRNLTAVFNNNSFLSNLNENKKGDDLSSKHFTGGLPLLITGENKGCNLCFL